MILLFILAAIIIPLWWLAAGVHRMAKATEEAVRQQRKLSEDIRHERF